MQYLNNSLNSARLVLLAVLVFILVLGFAGNALAAPPSTTPTASTPATSTPRTPGKPAADLGAFADVVQLAIKMLFGLGTLLAVVNVAWQGFRLMGGNPNSAQTAKANIIKAGFGLGAILFAWTIVGLMVNALTGP